MQNTLQECARNIAGGEKLKSYSAYDSRVASVVKDPRIGRATRATRRGEDRQTSRARFGCRDGEEAEARRTISVFISRRAPRKKSLGAGRIRAT